MTVMGINVSEFVKSNPIHHIEPVLATGIGVCVTLCGIGLYAHFKRTDDENKRQTYAGMAAGSVLFSLGVYKKWFLIPGKTSQGGLLIAGLTQLCALQFFTSLSDRLNCHDYLHKSLQDHIFPHKHLWNHVAGLGVSAAFYAGCYALFRNAFNINSGLSTHAFCCMALPIALTQAWANLYFRKV